MDVLLLRKKNFKRGMSFLLVISMVFSVISFGPDTSKVAKAANVWNTYVATSFEAGDGSKDNPYQIKWGSQLAYLARNVNEGETYSGKYFVITADITLNNDSTGNDWKTWDSDSVGLKEWTPIGIYDGTDNSKKKPFAGTINGEGHTVSGIWSCTSGTNGLFGYNTGVIDNINVKNSYIEGSGYGVGAIVGKNEGEVKNCSATASVYSRWADANNIEAGSAGGAVGTNSGTIDHVSVGQGSIIKGVGVVGGVVGTNLNRVANSSNSAEVGTDEVRSQYGTGGIVGCNSKEKSVVENCRNNGNITAENYAGGIVGKNTGNVVNSYSTATEISVNQNAGVAGAVIGTQDKAGFESYGEVSYSYYLGNMEIKIAGNPVSTVNAVGDAVSGTIDAATCLPYDLTGKLKDLKSVNFTINGSSSDYTFLADILDGWTQAVEGGKSPENYVKNYLRWEGERADIGLKDTASDVWDGNPENSFGGGDGTEGAPYRITNGGQLMHLAMQVNGGNSYSGSYFVLACDIILNDETFKFDADTGLIEVTDGDHTAYLGTGIAGETGNVDQFDAPNTPSVLGDWYEKTGSSPDTYGSISRYGGELKEWLPIGTEGKPPKPFSGNFDGKGYKIKGMYVRNNSCDGLFGYVSGGKVSNLEIDNSCCLSGGSDYIGSVAGYFSGNMSNCSAVDTVVCANKTSDQPLYCGGIVGYLADSKIDDKGEFIERGRVFGSKFKGTACSATDLVTGHTGGISGYTGCGSLIEECNTEIGTLVKGEGNTAGGITGKNYGGTVINTYNMGSVHSTVSVARVGGIVGENISQGESCLEGYADVFGRVVNCFNIGSIDSLSSSTGGIAGYNKGGSVENVYNDGSISAPDYGTIVGENGICEGEYTLYEGKMEQKYKDSYGTVRYVYIKENKRVYYKNLCVPEDSYIDKYSVYTGTDCTLNTPVFSGSATLLASLNSWIPGAGLGDDPDNKTYLKWVMPQGGSYPRFEGSHYQEVSDTEPYPKYALIYDPNGTDVKGEMKSVMYQMTLPTTPDEDKPVVAETEYSREGYNFMGWNTKPDGSGADFAPNMPIDITGTTTLYAIWKSTQAVITDIDKQGDSVTIKWDSVDDASGYWIYRHKVVPGEKFTQFKLSEKQGEVIVANNVPLEYHDADLDAGTYYYGIRAYSAPESSGPTATYVFKPFSEPAEVIIDVATITYNKNVTGIVETTTQDCVVDKAATIEDNTSFVNANYVFHGWNTKPDGTGDGYKPGDSIVLSGDITLYAVWKMEPVASLTGEIITSGQVKLTWTNSVIDGVKGYKIYCSIDTDDQFTELATVPKNNSASMSYTTINVINPAKIYYYKVTAYRDSTVSAGTLIEESVPSVVRVISETQPKLDDTKGDKDDNGKYTGIGGNEIYLKWDAQQGVTGYEIYRSTKESENGSKWGTVEAPGTTYTDKVESYGRYYYRIRSYTVTKDAGGNVVNIAYGSYSKALPVTVDSVTIEFHSNAAGADDTVPQVVGKNFEVELISVDDLKAMVSGGGAFTNSGFVFDGWNTTKDGTGKDYADKEKSQFAQDTKLYARWKIAVPANFASQILDNQLILSWDNNSSASGYEIYQKIEGGTFALLETIKKDNSNPGSTSYNNQYVVENFDASKVYSFYIKAFVEIALDADPNSGRKYTSYSNNSETIVVSPTDMPDEKVVAVLCQVNPDGDDGRKVKITWRKVSSASGYYIYRSDKEGFIGERIGGTTDNVYEDTTVPLDKPGDYYYTVRAYYEDENGVYYKVPSNPYKVTFDSVTISYRPNDAEGDVVEKNIIKGAAGVKVEECMFSYDMYEFCEWYSVLGQTEEIYKPGQEIPVDRIAENLILNASWKLKAVTINGFQVNKNSSVNLSWTSNDKATGYNIYQKKGANGTYVYVGTTEDVVFTTDVLTDVTATYYYYVVPYISKTVTQGMLQAEGIPSQAVSIIPDPEKAIAGQVTSLAAVVDRNNVTLTWDAVNEITGYYVYRSVNKGEHGELAAVVTANPETGVVPCTYTDDTLTEVRPYYYSVRAFVENDEITQRKPWSEYVEVMFEMCSITYVANNNTDDVKTETCIKGATVKAAENTYVFPGRCFVSWNTNSKGKGFSYNYGDELVVDSDVTLYAVWKVEKPQNVTVTVSEGKDSILVEWSPVVGADGYVVSRKNAKGEKIEERTTTTLTSYTDYNDGKKITADDAYFYYVRGYQVIDEGTRWFGDYSDTTENSVVGDAIVPTKAPVGTVSNLSVVGSDDEGLRLKVGWSGIPAADGYRVFYSMSKDGEKIYANEDTIGSNAWTQKLELDTRYYYYVVAYILNQATGEYTFGDYSDGLEVMITSTPAPDPTAVPSPSASPNPYGRVENLKGKVRSSSSIELSWEQNDILDAYIVYKCDNKSGDKPTRIDGNEVSGSSIVINGLNEGSQYYYRVRGYRNVQTDKGPIPDYSDWSDVLAIKVVIGTPAPGTSSPAPATPSASPSATPDVPGIRDEIVSSFVITGVQRSHIKLSWEFADGATEYEISYSLTPDGDKIVIRNIPATENVCDNVEIQDAVFNVRDNISVSDIQAYGQAKDAEYYYFIRATDGKEYSKYSDYVRIALHKEQLGTPTQTPAPAVPSPGSVSVPTASPTQTPKSSTDSDKYKVGSMKQVGKLIYRITAKSAKSRTVEVVRPVKKTYKTITIPATVKIGKYTYKVTTVKASAFMRNSKLNKIVFGKNINKIGAKALFGCRKLMNVTFRTKNIKSFGKKFFHGISMKCRVIIPKSVLAKYKKMIRETEG